ncbi:MAG: hypothetical protein Q9170_006097 [Blastenia crenularia]
MRPVFCSLQPSHNLSTITKATHEYASLYPELTQHHTSTNRLVCDCDNSVSRQGRPPFLVSTSHTQGNSDPTKTAHNERLQSNVSRPIVMPNEPAPGPEIYQPGDQSSDVVQTQLPTNVTTSALAESVLSPKEKVVELNSVAIRRNDNIIADKSDSEAETVVLEGKEEVSSGSTAKAIKNEDDGDASGSRSPRINGFHHASEDERKSDNGSDRPSLKRKRPSQDVNMDEHAPSSNLSSTVSSPTGQTHSSHDNESESDNTRFTPPLDEGIQQQQQQQQQQQPKSRKRKVASDMDDHNRKKRGKSDPNFASVRKKERRETRSATNHEVLRHRSDSPPSRRHHRAHSAQSVDHPDKSKRKKAPPPLLVERRRKTSEDIHGDSDDSSSVHSHPHLQKVASVDHTAISPAKISMKKYRDRNGRTPLARACAIDLAEAEKRLKERPQDIDVPDNAGNTPLQIASLEGFAEIVQLLLDNGCDINCKNSEVETPLIDAVENGHLEVVQMLLRAGLDPRQSNAKGEEPLDLVNPDNDDYDEIRAALIAARESNTVRRPSEDHSAQHRDNDMSSVGASAASPTDGQTGKSPPALSLGARRRTARSQPTQDSLLWVNPTPAKLREACGRGDLTVVDYILRMRPEVGTDAVIAAARGGHDVVLEILFAIGRPEHDPEPIESEDFKPGRNTPMLAAIGRGHIPVIKLLVSQRGFDPTRRMFRGLTYHEHAKERQGANWEEEYDILKDAYDDYKANGGRRSNHTSPRKVRTKISEAEQSTSTSPSSARRQLSTSSINTAPEPDIKREHSYKPPPNKHLQILEETKDSAILSDRDSESNGRTPRKPKVARSVSDAGAISSKHQDAAKPRRKLLSRNDLKSDQDTKRRASLVSDISSHDLPRRQSNDMDKLRQERQERKVSEFSNSVPNAKKEPAKDMQTSKAESGKKRPRLSASPQPHSTQDDKSSDVPKKKKQRRVDSEGNAVAHDPHRKDTVVRTGPAMVANMIASPEHVTSPTEPPNRAPVANMGVSTSPVTKSPTEANSQSEDRSPISGIEQTLQESQAHEKQPETKSPIPERPNGNSQPGPSSPKEAEDHKAAETERRARTVEAQREEERLTRLAQEEAKAQLEQQRQAEEAKRQARREQEEEEAARKVKKRREEELARRRADQERLRREEQERRRADHEERERQRRVRLQEEEQQQLRDALPTCLRRMVELSPEKARQAQEVRRWLPLYTVTTSDIDPGCDEYTADEKWIANVQAAPILAIKDLDLSQYTAWIRIPLSSSQRQSLWRQVRNVMSQVDTDPLTYRWEHARELDEETYPKFRDLKSMFWIKLGDFLDIVPRHPHLSGMRLKTKAMVLHENPWGFYEGEKNGLPIGGGGGINGDIAGNGAMVNGCR